MIDNQTLTDFKSRHRGGGSCGVIWRKAPSGIRVPGMGSGTATTLDVFRPRYDLPAWTASGREEGIESAAFSSGAALALLDRALADPDGMMPAALLRDRLALGAAEACLKFEGRRANEAEIRDAACLTRAGDALGPAGGMFDRWRRTARIDLARKDRADQLSKVLPDDVAALFAERVRDLPGPGGSGSSPVARAAAALAEALRARPREETSALIVADAVLARTLGWRRPVPLLAASLTRRDLAAAADGGSDAVEACHRAAALSAGAALRLAVDLERRAARLAAVAPKLRTRGAERALGLFLARDSVSPAMLAPAIFSGQAGMSGRAARRLCDRLTALGAVRELTGRATFRLYGL